MLEEYRNIAATHDKLREQISRIFNYFLLIAAVPFTALGILFRETGVSLLHAPLGVHLLFLVAGVACLFVALTIVDARMQQYSYARTVNVVRRYFAERAKNLRRYLYLPTSPEVPGFKDFGFVGKQIWLVVAVGTLYLAYGVYGLALRVAGADGATAIAGGLLVAALHLATFQRWSGAMISAREKLELDALRRLDSAVDDKTDA